MIDVERHARVDSLLERELVAVAAHAYERPEDVIDSAVRSASAAYVARRGGRAVGLACYRLDTLEIGGAARAAFYIGQVLVDPEHRRRGVPAALYRALREEIQREQRHAREPLVGWAFAANPVAPIVFERAFAQVEPTVSGVVSGDRLEVFAAIRRRAVGAPDSRVPFVHRGMFRSRYTEREHARTARAATAYTALFEHHAIDERAGDRIAFVFTCDGERRAP